MNSSLSRRQFMRQAGAVSLATLVARTGQAWSLPANPPGLSASMWIYLWDIVDEGYDVVFERLRSHGLTSISLATAYHAGKFLAPHNPQRKIVFLEDGRVAFQPDPSRYGRITPVAYSVVSEGHTLEKVQREAARFGLETRSWVVCCHHTPIGTAHPDLTTEIATGDRLLHNLCPSHPDVRRYLRGLVGDIASRGVNMVELEALQFQGYTHGAHHEREGIPLSAGTRFLLGLCFCPSCLARARAAGSPLDPLRRFVQKTVQELFERPAAVNDRYPSLDALPVDLFAPFFAWRPSVIASLAAELQEAAPAATLRPMTSVDPLARKMVGMDPARVAAVTGGILLLGYVKDGPALRPLLHDVMQQLPGKEATVGFQVGMPESGGETEFLDRLRTAREMGVKSFNFYNYGFIPLSHLSWISRGLR